jgi:hypothetical protein
MDKIYMAPTGIMGHVTTGTEGEHPFAVWQKKMSDQYGGKIYYLPSTKYIFGTEGQNALLLNDVKTEIIKLLDHETTAQEAYEKILSKVE